MTAMMAEAEKANAMRLAELSAKAPAPKSGNIVELERAGVTFGRGDGATQALTSTTLEIKQGEFVALVGPSGCGKSTILKIVAGLLQPSEGHVFVGGREVGARAARVGMAFQNPTMLPWLKIRDNVMLPLKIVSPFKADYRAQRTRAFKEKVDALLESVGLGGFADKHPWQLSGGMLQRASLCRALIHEPQLLLLDEPFGALDQFTREELWAIMQQLWMKHKPTVLLVTHDLREAGYLGTRIIVMSARPGRVISDTAVEFPYPRTVEMTFEPAFLALNQNLRSLIVRARSVAAKA